MPYIGRPLNAGNLAVQSGTGDGSDTTPIATLDYSVGSSNSIGVYLDGVRQLAGTDFTASGTALTFTTAPANGVGIDVYFLGLELSLPTPADASVTAAKLASDAVTTAKILNNAVDETKLKDALIADFTEVVMTASDSILLGDATDSGNTKRDTVQGLLDLVPASGITSYISSFSYDQSTTGSVAVTGVGFTPNVIIAHTVQAASPEASTGFGNAGDEHALRFDHNNSADTLSWSDFIGQILQSGSISSAWTIASYDADGFTYTKSKSGSATGTTKVLYLAMK